MVSERLRQRVSLSVEIERVNVIVAFERFYLQKDGLVVCIVGEKGRVGLLTALFVQNHSPLLSVESVGDGIAAVALFIGIEFVCCKDEGSVGVVGEADGNSLVDIKSEVLEVAAVTQVNSLFYLSNVGGSFERYGIVFLAGGQ